MYLPSLQEYEHMLRSFDWYFTMSDDYSVWKRGSERLNELLRLKAELDPHGIIWNRVKQELQNANRV